MKSHNMYGFVALLFFANCSTSNSSADLRSGFEHMENHVEVIALNRSTFPRQFISNGKLSALQKSDLQFNTSGIVKEQRVSNGEKVRKGEVIAVLDQIEYHHQLEQARTGFKKARMELQDVLIGQGYDLNDSTNIPEDIFETASIRSGYATAKGELADARYKLSQTVLRAPFGGVVANITQNRYEQVDTSKPFCTVIDASEFEVEFQLTETEVSDVRLRDSVRVQPISNTTTYGGVITEINPVVDEFGLIKLKATIPNPGRLLEGMNVKVIVEKDVPDQLVVPKSAVVLRQNQEILFKYVNGKALWTYVQTGMENSTAFTVNAHPDKGGSLMVGDTVITSGNLNLAHESDVTIDD